MVSIFITKIKIIFIINFYLSTEPLDYNATDEIELNSSDEEILVNPEIGLAFDTFETGT